MKIVFAQEAWEDSLYWQRYDKKILNRINLLIKEIERNPDESIGKPEKLKYSYTGYISRRITDEQRIVYKAADDNLFIVQLRYHY